MTKGPNPIPVRAQYPKPSGVPFIRACFAVAQRQAQGLANEDLERFIPADDTVAREMVNRAVAAPASTGTPGWAAELAQQACGQFLADLSPYSGAARLS